MSSSEREKPSFHRPKPATEYYDHSASGLGTPPTWLAPSGGAATAGAAVSPWTTVTKTADESVTSSTTPQNDDHLFFTAVAGGCYLIQCFVLYGSPAGAGVPDLRVAFGEDATAGRGVIRVNGLTGVNGVYDDYGFTDQVAHWFFGTAAADRMAFMYGYHLGAGGTFRLLWSQDTSNANPTIVRTGSIMRYEQVI